MVEKLNDRLFKQDTGGGIVYGLVLTEKELLMVRSLIGWTRQDYLNEVYRDTDTGEGTLRVYVGDNPITAGISFKERE